MKNRRTKRLIKPALQLKSALVLLGIAALAIIMQATLTMFTLTRIAVDLPSEGALILDRMPRVLAINVSLTIALLLPLMLAVGVLITHKIAGPIYRFEEYFKELIGGRAKGPCRLREGDQLQELCELINTATAPLLDNADRPAPAANEPASLLPPSDSSEDSAAAAEHSSAQAG